MTASTPQPYWRDWFEIVSDTALLQGDIFRDLLACWIPHDLPADPDTGAPDLKLRTARGDWMVLSASCDLARGDDLYVLLARVQETSDAALQASSPKDRLAKLEVMRRGNYPTMLLLPPCEDMSPPFPMSFVQYRVQTLLPIQYLRLHCGKDRLRLRPPFRERVGSWAGANLAQVGIRDDAQIPRFVKGVSATDVHKAIEELED